MHILLTEDNPVNRSLVIAMLDRLGHTYAEAVNGREAVAAVQTSNFDVILMDIQMPEMDGITATREIRKIWREDRPQLRIIALTASAKPEDRQECLEAGMDDFVTKPLTLEALVSALDMVVAHASEPADIAEGLIDTEQFDMITDVEDADSVETFWLFCDDVRSALSRLEALSERNDITAFKMLAYEQKSNSGTFGFESLRAALSRLEKKSLSGVDTLPRGWKEELTRLLDDSIDASGVPKLG